MDFSFFLRGFILGFSIAAPVGPIGILCIRSTLTKGRLVGLVSGLGAATADGIYGGIAAFGLTFIANFLMSYAVWLRLIGGLFLCYLGVTTFLAKPAKLEAVTESEKPTKFADYSPILRAYGSTFLLTLTNPITILAFATVFAGLGLANTGGNYVSAAILVLGVFAGSAAWWLLLSSGINLFRRKFDTTGLRWVNRVAGIMIVAFGVVALLSWRG